MFSEARIKRSVFVFSSVALAIPSVLSAGKLDYVLGNGTTGLIDMPSAAVQPDGQTSFTLAKDENLQELSIGFQALPRLEISLSFPTYDDVGGGVSSSSSSLNIKYQLLTETERRPAISFGINNLFANGRDSSEYIVATKNFGPLSATVGLGWGRLGSTSDIGAPFGSRPAQDPNSITLSHLFRGDAGVFGGLAWQTPIKGLTLVGEYSSDNFSNEAVSPKSRYSFGAQYRVAKGVNLSVFHKYGSTTGVRLSFTGNPFQPYVAPDLGPGPQPLVIRPAKSMTQLGWETNDNTRKALIEQLRKKMADEGLSLLAARITHDTASLTVQSASMRNPAKIAGRVARILTGIMPASVNEFRITFKTGGLMTNTVVLDRTALERTVDQPASAMRMWQSARIEPAPNALANADWIAPTPRGFSWKIHPAVKVDIANDQSLDPIISIVGSARYSFSPQTYISGALSYRVIGQSDQAPAPATPLPRSDSASYVSDTILLNNLTLTHLFKLRPEIYGRVSIGYFERMYGGVSGEIIWRPANRNYAFGIELTHARKRDYDNPFAFLDYTTTTGFASLYWDFGNQGIYTQVDVGRFIAKDWGGKITLGRTFPNGWDVAVSTTWSDEMTDSLRFQLSAKIPLSWTAPVATKKTADLSIGGRYADDGSTIGGTHRLYGLIKETNPRRIRDGWGSFWN